MATLGFTASFAVRRVVSRVSLPGALRAHADGDITQEIPKRCPRAGLCSLCAEGSEGLLCNWFAMLGLPTEMFQSREFSGLTVMTRVPLGGYGRPRGPSTLVPIVEPNDVAEKCRSSLK